MEGGGRGEERETRSEKVILADPIRVSHLFTLLRAKEDLTQAEPRLQYQMNSTLYKQPFFWFEISPVAFADILYAYML